MGKLEEYMKGRTEGMEFASCKRQRDRRIGKRNQIPESHRHFPERYPSGIKCGQWKK